MTSQPLKFGLVGYGAWGGLHAQSIAKTEGAELAAIAAPSEASRNRAQADHSTAHVCENYLEIVNDPSIDIVDIVVPSHLHHEIAKAALEGFEALSTARVRFFAFVGINVPL